MQVVSKNDFFKVKKKKKKENKQIPNLKSALVNMPRTQMHVRYVSAMWNDSDDECH